MDFRTRLREQIEYSGMLDKEVAAKAGISKRTIDSYVGSQGCMPSADVAVRLAQALGVSVEYLVTGRNMQAGISEQEQHVLSCFKRLSGTARNAMEQCIALLAQD